MSLPIFASTVMQALHTADANTLQWIIAVVGGANSVVLVKGVLYVGKLIGELSEFKQNTQRALDNLPCRSGSFACLHGEARHESK